MLYHGFLISSKNKSTLVAWAADTLALRLALVRGAPDPIPASFRIPLLPALLFLRTSSWSPTLAWLALGSAEHLMLKLLVYYLYTIKTRTKFTSIFKLPFHFTGERNYGSAVDMWGAGCIMAEMWTRVPILQVSPPPPPSARSALSGTDPL